MKRMYKKPIAKKVTFSFERVLAQSSVCGSGIVFVYQPGQQCWSKTPDTSMSPSSNSYEWRPDPNTCGWQSSPQ